MLKRKWEASGSVGMEQYLVETLTRMGGTIMKQKRILALLLAFFLLASLFSACGRDASAPGDGDDEPSQTASSSKDADKEEPEPSDQDDSDDGEEPDDADDGEEPDDGDDGDDGDAAFGEGEELSGFINTYLDAKSKPMDLMNEALSDSDDFTLTMGILGVSMVDLYVAFVPMFDIVDDTGYVAMLNLKNAYRDKKGSVITFGADYVREEDSGNDKKGDREYWEGELDEKDESLRVMYYTERNGKVVDKTVMEITKNKDGSYTSQTLVYQEGEDGDAKTTANLIQFEGEDMDVISGTRSENSPDFDYDTVFKTRNADIRQLAGPYEITLDVSFRDGEAVSNLK